MRNKFPMLCPGCRTWLRAGEGLLWSEPGPADRLGRPTRVWKACHPDVGSCMARRGERALGLLRGGRTRQPITPRVRAMTPAEQLLLLRAEVEQYVHLLGLVPAPARGAQPLPEVVLMHREIEGEWVGWVGRGPVGIVAFFGAPGEPGECWVSPEPQSC